MENNLQKIDELENYLKEKARFYISTPGKLAEALIFSKKLKEFSEQIEESVKKRGSELMSEQELNEINFDGWKVIKVEPTEIEEFQTSSIINAVGIEIAKNLMKVDNTKLKLWIKKSKLEGEIIGKISEGKRIKLRKGYIKILEIKEKEDKEIYIQ